MPGMVAHDWNGSTWEAGAGISPWVQGQFAVHFETPSQSKTEQNKECLKWVWWCLPVIPPLWGEGMRPEDWHKLKASLNWTGRSCLKKTTTTNLCCKKGKNTEQSYLPLKKITMKPAVLVHTCEAGRLWVGVILGCSASLTHKHEQGPGR